MGTERNVKILFVDISSILVLATIIFFTFVPEILIERGMIFLKHGLISHSNTISEGIVNFASQKIT